MRDLTRRNTSAGLALSPLSPGTCPGFLLGNCLPIKPLARQASCPQCGLPVKKLARQVSCSQCLLPVKLHRAPRSALGPPALPLTRGARPGPEYRGPRPNQRKYFPQFFTLATTFHPRSPNFPFSPLTFFPRARTLLLHSQRAKRAFQRAGDPATLSALLGPARGSLLPAQPVENAPWDGEGRGGCGRGPPRPFARRPHGATLNG